MSRTRSSDESKQPRKPRDAEIKIMASFVRQFEALPPDSRTRVIRWLSERFSNGQG